MIGIIYERTHSRLFIDNAGISQLAPRYVMFLGFFSFSSFAFPGTNSFVGEFLVLLGAFTRNKWVGALAAPGALLAAAYMLRLLLKIMWGGKPEKPEIFFDLRLREISFLVPLLVLVFWIGLWPGVFLRFMDNSIQYLLTDIIPRNVGIWP
jgi:NADH-quinone oxidoreductase subunit M